MNDEQNVRVIDTLMHQAMNPLPRISWHHGHYVFIQLESDLLAPSLGNQILVSHVVKSATPSSLWECGVSQIVQAMWEQVLHDPS